MCSNDNTSASQKGCIDITTLKSQYFPFLNIYAYVMSLHIYRNVTRYVMTPFCVPLCLVDVGGKKAINYTQEEVVHHCSVSCLV